MNRKAKVAAAADPGIRKASSPALGARFSRRGYTLDPSTLAQCLLGCVLVRRLDNNTRLSGRIVETEAYLGVKDACAHSFGGRRTPRVEPMYALAGTAYVYFTYGMHHCMNVVCGEVGEPVAVLLRALEPLEGQGIMRERRANSPLDPGTHKPRIGKPPRDADLCRGPASICRAMAIEVSHSGLDMTAPDAPIWIERGDLTPAERDSIECTPRIGLGQDSPWVKRKLRWLVGMSKSVSG